MAKQSLKEQLATLDEEIRAEELALWGGVQAGATGRVDLVTSPKFREIVAILHEQPLLVAPTLKWLMVKRADMAKAQLGALYTPDELDEMAKQLQS